MSGVNKVIILGRLGQDPELKYTPSGAAVCNFSVATSESWADKSGQKQEKTEWHRIIVWGKLGELCNQYLAKGRQAYVEGSLQTRSWEGKDGSKRYTTEVVARNVQFGGGRNLQKEVLRSLLAVTITVLRHSRPSPQASGGQTNLVIVKAIMFRQKRVLQLMTYLFKRKIYL